MSTPREDEDAALIDRLYGGEDVGGLASVRGMIARVREEQVEAEPSQAVIAKLLLAAQEHAPKRKVVDERAGLWARLRAWMTPLLAHPGLAAAATLVIVGGATAVWMSRGGEVAEPMEKLELPARHAGLDEAKAEAGRGAVASAPAAPEPPAGSVAKAPSEPRAAPATKPERVARQERAPTKKPAPKKDLGRGPGAGDSAAGVASADEDQVRRDAPASAGVRSRIGGQNAPAQTEAAPPPPPPSAPEPAPAPADRDEEAPVATAPEKTGEKADEKPADKPVDRAARLRQLTEQARAAAKQGDCKRVATLGAEVKKLDASYYEKTFSTDATISACRPAP